MTARVTSALLVSALIRRAGHEGGSAVVVSRGEAEAGAIVLSLYEKGEYLGYRERVLSAHNSYTWRAIGPTRADATDEAQAWLARRRAQDPDLWVVELNVANVERLVAETSGDS